MYEMSSLKKIWIKKEICKISGEAVQISYNPVIAWLGGLDKIYSPLSLSEEGSVMDLNRNGI